MISPHKIGDTTSVHEMSLPDEKEPSMSSARSPQKKANLKYTQPKRTKF